MPLAKGRRMQEQEYKITASSHGPWPWGSVCVGLVSGEMELELSNYNQFRINLFIISLHW
jgi:hypothetical protein